MQRILFFLFIISFPAQILSQRNVTDSTLATPIFGVQYGALWSGADLAERYGYWNHVGLTAGYKIQSNWYFGLEGNFMFGKNTTLSNQDLFGHLMDENGNITDQNGDVATVLTFARGFHVNLEIGKVFPALGHNANSGLFVKLGGGYLNHRIRIETNDHVVPTLELDYKKGYDRLTTGFNASQFLGYLFMSNSGFLNFYVGAYCQEGFTQNKRNQFYDKPNYEVPKDTRFDLQYGAKIGWLIPIYKRQPKDFYYN